MVSLQIVFSFRANFTMLHLKFVSYLIWLIVVVITAYGSIYLVVYSNNMQVFKIDQVLVKKFLSVAVLESHTL